MPEPTPPTARRHPEGAPDGWGSASLGLGVLALLTLPLVLPSPALGVLGTVCGAVSVAAAGERGASRVRGWAGIALGATAAVIATVLLVTGRWLVMVNVG
ncbi:MAG: hypothetical protein U0237_07855 [Thermoleophilia bacterium]